MYSHSRTLFRQDDGTKIRFVILKPGFDTNIVASLIQWGGGSVIIKDEPVASAINLSCRKIQSDNIDVFNTSFVHACCFANTLLDLNGFRLGRNHCSSPKENTKSISKCGSPMPPPSADSGGDMLQSWLKNIPCPAELSNDGNESARSKMMDDERDVVSLLENVLLKRNSEAERSVSMDSEIFPDDSASVLKPKFNVQSPELHPSNDSDQDTITSEDAGNRIESQVRLWLSSNSSENSD